MTNLVDRVGSWIDHRTSRRGFLARSALVGSAAAAGPVSFLVKAQSAEAALLPANCPAGATCKVDGFTEFCCSVTRRNVCPPATFVGGYWKCSNYRGSGYCASTNVRYYMDCNARPGDTLPPDFPLRTCANADCKCRHINFKKFQYMNCNTNTPNYRNTRVVCRVVLCHNPAQDVSGCSATNVKFDPATCSHQACRKCTPDV